MRVLYICNEYPPAIHGGIGIFVRMLAEHLASTGHETAVIGFASHVASRMEDFENGVRVVRLPWPRTRGELRMGRFRVDSSVLSTRKMLSREATRLAADFRANLVESHDWSGPLWAAPCRPWVARLHGAAGVRGSRGARLIRYFERRNIRGADAVVAASEYIGERTRRVLRLRCEPFVVIHHGIDVDRFRPQDLQRDPNEVLFAATVKKSKGILDFFKALPLVARVHPRARFTIAGRYNENSSDCCSPQRLLETIPGELQRSVQFLGHVAQPKLARLYSRAAAVVFPSRSEAFGLACCEAMACGAAVVMTARGSGPELVEHKRSGLLVEPSDTASVGSAISHLLRDVDLRRNLGCQARLRVVEKFNLSTAAERNVAFYERVAGSVHARERIYV